MPITVKTFMQSGLKAKIDNYYAPNVIAFLVNDSGGTLTNASTMVDVSALELPSGNGYARQLVTLPTASIIGGNAESQSDDIVFQASGGNIPTFSHICFVVGGNTTVGDSSGVIDRVEPVNNNSPISLQDGESYIHSYLHRETGNYV